ncbi:NADP-dependent oxidoreductase [Amycolatopsis sp. H20-H5]|uniref:NADP-dependent oxidoreductase n=1 Tax=Amycolatopsis sp. H20-H5 TaxID=3046309 RepID=UPI002DB9721A|nr:NADP-dependent oxidoreductase [Amycolatopsis sp. H20-H5]MEC3981513.1 NADP-dependent oxidoreductase [Amycolatopsis sp. H20-H5]
MRVVTQDEFGGPEVLKVVEAKRPEPAPTEILLRVHAAGINPVDWKSRAHEVFMGNPPFTLGWDVSGVVEAVGFGTTGLSVGDEVLGMPKFPGEAAAYADYVTAPSRQFVRKPAGLSHVEAAGLPLAGLTAWQGLVDLADVQPGQRVLIDAAAGGVGHLAVQIAKARGAYVLGTASAGKHDFLRSIGVDEPIDYRDPAATATDLDLVFGLVNAQSDLRWLPSLNRGGLIVSVPGGTSDDVMAEAAKLGVRTARILVEPDQIGLHGLVELIEAGKLRVHVDQAFPLEDVAKAHELGEGGRVTGKLVLTTS